LGIRAAIIAVAEGNKRRERGGSLVTTVVISVSPLAYGKPLT